MDVLIFTDTTETFAMGFASLYPCYAPQEQGEALSEAMKEVLSDGWAVFELRLQLRNALVVGLVPVRGVDRNVEVPGV